MQENKVCDRPSDGQTDGPTNRVTYRVACTRLKTDYKYCTRARARGCNQEQKESPKGPRRF